MKILVTGADGFIGSHLVEKLLLLDYEVKAFCLYNSFGTKGWLDSTPSNLIQKLEVFFGDIRDLNSVKEAMNDCTHVFHLAALISIPYSYIAPSSYIDTNIYGTYNILQAARDLQVSQIIHTSTSETYGTAQYVPIDEKHPLVGQSPYSATKIAADQLAISFWKSFSTPVSILRPFNTYGPRQSSRAVIPTIITQIASGQKKIKIGKLSPTRDFNFVEDTCNSFIKILDCDDALGKVINSASNFEVSIGQTVDLITQIMDADVDIISEEKRFRPSNSEVNRLCGDNSLLRELTGWVPEYSGIKGFQKGLEKTIKWFSNPKNLEKYSAKNFLL
tara:strand:+ start:8995 stop:9990 length:996 start_codon:yes stop_codon:yes gene_type:complete